MATKSDRKGKVSDTARGGIVTLIPTIIPVKNTWWLILVGLFVWNASCHPSFQTADAQYEAREISNDQISSDESLEQLLLPYRETMNEQMDVVLAISTQSMKLGHPESTLGNFAGDATEAMAEKYTGEKVAFGMQNYSGLRIKSIGKGEITLGRIYELMPFDNFLVTVVLTGAEVQQLCDYLAGRGGWPTSKSLTYQIIGDRASNIKIDGESVNPTQNYVLATNDYIVRSSSIRSYFEGKEVHNTNVYVRDAFAEYLRSFSEQGQKYNPVLDQRVSKQ